MDDTRQAKLIKDLKLTTFEEVLLGIGSLRYTPVYIVNLLYEDKKNVQDLLLDKVMNSSNVPKINYKNDIIVSGLDDILVNLASCCKPVKGDEIVGYITKGQGITVHKCDCVNIKDITERLIDVKWNESKGEDAKQYISKLTILTNGLKSNLLDIVTKATQRSVIVSSINEMNRNGNLYYDLLVKVKGKNDLDLFIDELKTLSFVSDVKRY